jgi:hypothetical protein
VDNDGALYYAYSTLGESQEKVFLSEKTVLAGDDFSEMNPLIFYRIAKPKARDSLQGLPVFKTVDFFAKEEHEEEKSSKISL